MRRLRTIRGLPKADTLHLEACSWFDNCLIERWRGIDWLALSETAPAATAREDKVELARAINAAYATQAFTETSVTLVHAS